MQHKALIIIMHSYVMYPFVYPMLVFASRCNPLELNRAAASLILANIFAQHRRAQLTRQLGVIECENVKFISSEPNQISRLTIIMVLLQIDAANTSDRAEEWTESTYTWFQWFYNYKKIEFTIST